MAEESYSRPLSLTCVFSYLNEQNPLVNDSCFPRVKDIDFFDNGTITTDELPFLNPPSPSIVLNAADLSKAWFSWMDSSTIPPINLDNVAEPTFGINNQNDIFYAGNHFAARLIDYPWQFVDPNFDFKGKELVFDSDRNETGEIIDLFKADQHIEYDPLRDMFLWLRLSDDIEIDGSGTNILRLAVSKDTVNWLAYDFVAKDVLNEASIPLALFDYPDTILSKDNLYITTSVYDVFGEALNGVILRIPLNPLSSDLNMLQSIHAPASRFNYEIILDKEVNQILPVQGSPNPIYFGAQVPFSNSEMKIYQWTENDPDIQSTILEIEPYNKINNENICNSGGNVSYWWCYGNTDSRLRSAWFFQNSLNFLWNSVTSYDSGQTWIPYVDSVTFYIDQDYYQEKKYHLADNSTGWLFGSGTSNYGKIGVGALYYDLNTSNGQSNPLINYAFGKYNDHIGKWEMSKFFESSHPLPVIDENGNADFNIGDFLTTKPHRMDDRNFLFDASGYVIVGENYYDIINFLLLVR